MIPVKIVCYTLLAFLFTATACVAGGVGQPDDDNLKSEIRHEVKQYSLNLVDWEITNFITPVKEVHINGVDGLSEKISLVLKEQDIPVVPPVHTRITLPPLLLVISPKDKIVYWDRVLLYPDLNDNQIEEIENKVDALGLSSLVTKIGGFGAAYPSIVSPDMGEANQVNAAVEEWAHQYLAFRPLGFLYLLDSLGFSQPSEIISMNETLAGIIADEIGDEVYARYYNTAGNQNSVVKERAGFDFDKEMRETRRTVDSLLKDNAIERAELYMNERRLIFIQHGYKIRKLNQAYFAFHAIYGQDPCSVSPIYNDMTRLRNSYDKLSDFVNEVTNISSYEGFQAAIKRLP